MKEGWEIKKLGEVCDVVGGSTPKTSEESYWGGEHYWISPAELDGSKYVYSTSRTITEDGIKSAHLQMLPIGTVLLSSRAPIGKVAITKVPMYCNQGFKNLVCKNEVLNEFVYWFLLHNTEYLNSLGTGATFKEISKKVVEQVSIPVPPIAEQEKIVAELDCLSGIIEKKKQQLKEYDALAQSIFYEMFGDPVENEKGWVVKNLGDACIFQQGIQVPIEEQFEIQQEGMIRFLRIVDFTQGNEKPRYVYVDNEKHILKDKEIAIVRYGTPGFVCYGKYGVIANNLFKIKPLTTDISYKFFIHWLKSEAFQSVVVGNQYGAALQAIKFSTIKDIAIILPPLALQQAFASKIEAIEKQKELIKKSIEEVETLFNSRMDYYFN